VASGPLPPDSETPRPLRPLLAQWNFGWLWWGQLISILGERLTYLALIGMLVEHTGAFADRSKSSILLTLLANVMLAPVLLFSPFAGAWIDRWNLQRTLVLSDLARSILVVLIPVLYAMTGHTGPMFVIVFLMFTCNVLFLPAKSAITPDLVAAPQLLAANAFLAGAGIAATAIGALAGGWVVDHWGWQTALWINGGTYLVSVVALMVIRYTPHLHAHVEGPTVRRYLSEVTEGWNLVRRNAVVGVALLALATVWIGGGFLHVAGNQHIQRSASAPGMERLGVLMAMLGIGAGAGTWWVNTHGRRVPRAWLLGGGLVIVGMGIAIFAVSARFWVYAGVAVLVGVAIAPSFMLTETLLQQGTEPRQRGRIFSARDFLMRLAFMLSVSFAGWTVQTFGITPTMMMCAVTVMLAGIVTMGWGSRVRELNDAEIHPPAA
jgi:MFS family permease